MWTHYKYSIIGPRSTLEYTHQSQKLVFLGFAVISTQNMDGGVMKKKRAAEPKRKEAFACRLYFIFMAQKASRRKTFPQLDLDLTALAEISSPLSRRVHPDLQLDGGYRS